VSRAALALLLAAGCHSAPPGAKPAADSCTTRTGRLPATAAAAELAGEYRIRLVATRGPGAGAAADGRLALRPQADSLQRSPPMLGVHDITTLYPVAGALEDIAPEALGATRTGAMDAADVLAPGVLGIERRTAAGASPTILLRLGSDANHRGVVRFDGGYFVLTVRRLEPGGFGGTWSSGAVGEEAAGYFCAERSVR
jgi:hypothetical protein